MLSIFVGSALYWICMSSLMLGLLMTRYSKYFLAFFLRNFACENLVFFWNVSLFWTRVEIMSAPILPSSFIVSMSSLVNF